MSRLPTSDRELLVRTAGGAVLGSVLGVLVIGSWVSFGLGARLLIALGATAASLFVMALLLGVEAPAHRSTYGGRRGSSPPTRPSQPKPNQPMLVPTVPGPPPLTRTTGRIPRPQQAGRLRTEPSPPSTAVDLPNWWAVAPTTRASAATTEPVGSPSPAPPAASTYRQGRRVVQCPQCTGLRIDVKHTAQGVEFHCIECSRRWQWAPGLPWPVVAANAPGRALPPTLRG